MSTYKHFDKICCVVIVLILIITVFFMNMEQLGTQKKSIAMEYEKTLFDASKVHTIDIVMDDWDEFIDNCKSEKYYECAVIIDNETYKNVAIRGKGNTSLSQVSNDRYSYKIEFDHYDSTNTYHGLDKLCLNNIIQDNTYMKDYLTYQMMNDMGVAAPLCSYAYITVNGEDWGLYLAIEGVEDSFLQRNYGKDYGELYKPDSMNMGGGRGNGEKFKMDEFMNDSNLKSNDEGNSRGPEGIGEQPPNGMIEQPPFIGSNNDNRERKPNNQKERPGGMDGGASKGSDDVLLKYIDDNIESYSNILESAKTDITKADKNRLIKALKQLSNGKQISSAVDIEAVIRYFVVHNFVVNFDSYTGSMIHNYYLYEYKGKMQMIPWDYNLAFGGFKSAGGATSLVNYPIDSPVSGGNVSERPMIAWIFENEEYMELYHKYMLEFIIKYFDSGYFSEMMDKVNIMISPYVEKDSTKFCTYEEFKAGITTLKEFCLLRAESINGQLKGTIGATSDTQKNETLIDASNIQIENMGSMSKTMGKDRGNFGSDAQAERIPKEDMQGDQKLDEFAGGKMQEEAPPEFPDSVNEGQGFNEKQMQRPDNNKQPNESKLIRQQASMSSSDLVTIGISILVLVAGLSFSLLFKRRKS